MRNGILTFLVALAMFSCEPAGRAQCPRHEAVSAWMKSKGYVKVLCTTALLEDMVRQVGHGAIVTVPLISGALDPHSYQLVKGDDELLSSADLIVAVGLGLEHGPTLQQYLQDSKKSVSIGDRIRAKDPGLIVDTNGVPDPHIWMDISLWAKGVDVVVDALEKADPAHQELYRMNGEALKAQLREAHERVQEVLLAVPDEKRYLVTAHSAFGYFARAYLATPGERESDAWRGRTIAPEGLAPESMISSSDIKTVIDFVVKHNVLVLFPESNVNRDSLKKIASACQEMGRDVRVSKAFLYGDTMGCSGDDGDTYVKMMKYDSKVIAKGILARDG